MRIDSRKPKAAALSAALTVALLAGAGATDAHAATLSDTVGSTPSETTLVQPVDYRGDGYGSMQEWNASMEAKRDSLEMRAQIIMNMYGDYATDDERAVLQGCIDGAGSLLTMGEVDAKSTELDELRTALENAKREALEAAAAEAEAAEAAQASYYNACSGLSYTSAAYYANGSGLTRSSGVNNYNGRRETYYSSNVLYHHRTGEWTQDSRAFGAIPMATTSLPRAIRPKAPRLPVPRASARSMTPAVLPEPPTTIPVGNLPSEQNRHMMGGRLC